jgi:hypothetical protein
METVREVGGVRIAHGQVLEVRGGLIMAEATTPLPPIVMVSSTVHGQTGLLDQVYGILTGLGYTVWMSHAGTVPVNPGHSNFENCLRAVQRCSLFLGIITGRYGSGRHRNQLSITHCEILEAISHKKPRWFLVHRDIEVARQLLRQYRYTKHRPPRRRRSARFEPTPVLDDIRVLDMYESAMRYDLPLDERRGNWVQPYIHDDEALRFIMAQFGDRSGIGDLLAQPAVKGGRS